MRQTTLRTFLWSLPLVLGAGPRGTLVPTSTLFRGLNGPEDPVTDTLRITYLDPVLFTLQFDQSVVDFKQSNITVNPEVEIHNFTREAVDNFTFIVYSKVNVNVSISIATGAVKGKSGTANSEVTGQYRFQYYAFPPAPSLRLYGFQDRRTNQASNLVYLFFNSTTDYLGDENFYSSMLTLTPDIEIRNFERVSDVLFKFNFDVPVDPTGVEPDNLECVLPGEDVGSNFSKVLCRSCPRSQRCVLPSDGPLPGLLSMEFPISVNILEMDAVGSPNVSLTIIYDTFWAEVELEAPEFAREFFFITVRWTEPMKDLTTTQPIFRSGPTVDQDVLQQSTEILNPHSFRMLVAPSETGILTISINGTKESEDLAGNSNDFRRISGSRTGSSVTVIYSAGPPVEGIVECFYKSVANPQFYSEGATFDTKVQSLTISWSGFVTAMNYELWLTWPQNSTKLISNLKSENHTFEQEIFFGLDYVVHLRAFNHWGNSRVSERSFQHPKVSAYATGQFDRITLPPMLSSTQTRVYLNVYVKPGSFISSISSEILTFRNVDRKSGDADACVFVSQALACTYINFHIEVPGSQFVFFRRPIQLEISFGPQGWLDEQSWPQLRYWETYHEEWRLAVDSCTRSQAFEQWDRSVKIYRVSLCHLTQFAIFKNAVLPRTTTTSIPTERQESESTPVFFAGFAGVVVFLSCLCCACACHCKKNKDRAPVHAVRTLSSNDTAQRVHPADSQELLNALPFSSKAVLKDDTEKLVTLPIQGT